MKGKIKTIKELKEIINNKHSGKKIVFTNGCFDLLHVGHVRYLYQAKKRGNILIVGLNDDKSVSVLKGKERPIVPVNERAEILASLEMVDYIVIFSELTANNLIRQLKPDVYVKGGDYNINNLPEAGIVKSYGGKIELMSLIEGRSTTEIIKKIKVRYK